MTIADIAREVGFTAPNLRLQFKRCYGVNPAEYRAGLVTTDDEEDI
jgi:AraC-like DNA-binding protein